MTGQNNFIAKAFHLVMDVDKMVGGDFEKGAGEPENGGGSAPQEITPQAGTGRSTSSPQHWRRHEPRKRWEKDAAAIRLIQQR